ncbi:MAG: hypothetical protein SchgKO_02040 [Schleiferiaceae bacterium]
MLINTHTYYSLRYGTLSEADLLKVAEEGGHKTIAITDINTTTACYNALRASLQSSVRVIAGVDFRDGAQQKYIGIAKNAKGFRELNQALTLQLHSEKPPAERAPEWKNCHVIYPFEKDRFFALGKNEWVGVRPEQLASLPFSAWRNHLSKLVILQTGTFRYKKDHNAHRLLRAIENNCLLSRLPAKEQAPDTDVFWSFEKLSLHYSEYPELIDNTLGLINSCTFNYDFGIPKNKKVFSESVATDIKMLRELTHKGALDRYGEITPELEERLQKELSLVIQKGFVAYFLISWDIVRYAREKGYYYVGRGSGANSVIAYCLRITDVDPIDLSLYFERFINLYRENPPDFDMDFSWRDREDVTRYVFEKHGTEHTALLATYNTFQYRATLRELGKVFGLPKAEIDELVHGKKTYDQLDTMEQLVVRYSDYIQGFPNYLSIHAGGILITEEPIAQFSGTFMPPKGFPTVMFDMIIAEDIGLYKYDVLSQRGLGHIKDTVSIVRENRDEYIDIHNIAAFKKDPGVIRQLQSGKAIGCFYVESPAMRQLLTKLECNDYLSLVAASSIIRPGVASSGMMREYILRYRDPKRRTDAHPIMLDIMPETFGIMVYQEDVIKVAHYFAELTLGEADVLRRGMSGKYRSREEFQRIKDQFFSNCDAKGYDRKVSSEIWFQIESFAGYSFSKGHSASYAVESFQSLFLKTYYPLEFMVGVINNYGGFYRTEFYVHEARQSGATIEPPCMVNSRAQTHIYDTTIYLGFVHIDGLESATTLRILEERQRNGHFEGFRDFVDRVPCGLEQAKLLIQSGAFRYTGMGKKELYWEAHLLLGGLSSIEDSPTLFREKAVEYQLPTLEHTALEDAYDQIERLGFPLCSPFFLADCDLEKYPERAANLIAKKGKNITILGYLVTTKPTKTKGGDRMGFGTFIDIDGNWLDTTHFPAVYKKFPFRGSGVYKIQGTVDEEFGVYTVTVKSMIRMASKPDPRYAEETRLKKVPSKKELGKN